MNQLPHTEDPIARLDGTASYEMRAWMESVERQLLLTNNYTSTLNSTTDNVGAGLTWEGEWEPTDLRDVGVVCKLTGEARIYVEFSNDGGTTYSDFPPAGFYVDTTTPAFHIAEKLGRSFKLRLEDTGGAGLTNVQLYVYVGTFRQGNSPINLGIKKDADAIITRSVDTRLDLALGRFGGMEEDAKFGRVEDVDAADGAKDIWAMADDTFANVLDTKTFPASAATLYIASDNAADTDLEVTVVYLDANLVKREKVINLDGTDARTAVSLAVSGIDSNRAFLSGDNETAAGNIYVANNASFTAGVPSTLSNTLCMIPIGYGQTQQVTDTVPAGKKRRIKRVIAYVSRASGAAGSAVVHFRIRLPSGSWRVIRDYAITTSSPLNKEVAGMVFPEGTQIVMRVNDVSDTDTTVFADFHYDDVDA